MNKNIPLICYDCNLPLSNWDKFLNKKYPTNLGYILCSDCTKKREKKLIKELADSLSDLSFYDYDKQKEIPYDPKMKDYYFKGRLISFMFKNNKK